MEHVIGTDTTKPKSTGERPTLRFNTESSAPLWSTVCIFCSVVATSISISLRIFRTQGAPRRPSDPDTWPGQPQHHTTRHSAKRSLGGRSARLSLSGQKPQKPRVCPIMKYWIVARELDLGPAAGAAEAAVTRGSGYSLGGRQKDETGNGCLHRHKHSRNRLRSPTLSA